MKTIKLLDCTLRDGGYINNWNFGEKHIRDTILSLEKSGVDILETGFIRSESTDSSRTVFARIEDINSLIPNKKVGITYAAMAEATKPVEAETVAERSCQSVDAIRVIIWKDKHDENGRLVDALQEGYEYCKIFADKGYELFVQPARTEQYSDEEFIHMLKMYSRLNPKAVYIVDSWGTMYPKDVLHYLELADKHLAPEVSIGFHGHNNMMQAFANSMAFIEAEVDRELILDASVFGIGRGAGNLNSEIIAHYLNEKAGKEYDIKAFFEVYEHTVKEIRQNHVWGYTPAYFMSAFYHANPQYATWYGVEHDVDSLCINDIMKMISPKDKVLYTASKAQRFLDDFQAKCDED